MEFFQWIFSSSPKRSPDKKFKLNFSNVKEKTVETNTARLIEYLTDHPQNWSVTKRYVNKTRYEKKYLMYRSES